MKSYKQYCGVAKALDLVGQRWTLLLVRELLPGPRRFTDLLLPGLTPNVLSDRLRHLEGVGLLAPSHLPGPGSRPAWALTEQGRALEPVVFALGEFGGSYLKSPEGLEARTRWLLTSLQRRWSGELDARVQVFDGTDAYRLRFDSGVAVLTDGEWEEPDCTVRGQLPVLAALFGRGQITDALVVGGDATVLEEVISGLSQW